MITEKLTDIFQDNELCSGDALYSFDELKNVCDEVIELSDNAWLFLKKTAFDPLDQDSKDNFNLSFLCCRCAFEDGEGKRVQVIFQGDGPVASLREPRHIYWGPDGNGYTFYLPADAVIKALEHLKKYFDFD